MTIVLDTGILARAHPRSCGLARALLDLVLDRGDDLIITDEIAAELDRVMRYPRMLRHSNLADAEIAEYVQLVKRSARMLTLFAAPIPPISDCDDIHVVQAAICANADYLCTLDKHFFEAPVVAFCADRGVTIISDIDLLRKLRQ